MARKSSLLPPSSDSSPSASASTTQQSGSPAVRLNRAPAPSLAPAPALLFPVLPGLSLPAGRMGGAARLGHVTISSTHLIPLGLDRAATSAERLLIRSRGARSLSPSISPHICPYCTASSHSPSPSAPSLSSSPTEDWLQRTAISRTYSIISSSSCCRLLCFFSPSSSSAVPHLFSSLHRHPIPSELRFLLTTTTTTTTKIPRCPPTLCTASTGRPT